MKTWRAFLMALICIVTAVAAVPALATDCITGTVTATETPANSGIWKYCISFSYDVTSLGNSPSHFSLLVGALAECPCTCDTGVIWFDNPAGSSSGTGDSGPCTVDYNGLFACDGDPTLPGDNGPTLKWEVPEDPTCEPDLVGTGTLCFYSLLQPAPSSTGIAIKLGQQSCNGTVTGDLPSCSGCPVSTKQSTWGQIKALYRY